MGKRLVICIPTYNRWDVVEDVLASELHILKKYQVDIILYDSGEGDETEKVCENYQQQGYDNLFYRRVASEIPSNQKVYMIYREMETSAYDYVWMIHDYKICEEDALCFLLEQLKKDADFYAIDYRAREEYQAEAVTSKERFFKENVYSLTLYGAAVVNRERVIVGTDWQELEKKYVYSEAINFSHVGFYFERIDVLDKPQLVVLYLKKNTLRASVKKVGNRWYDETIRVWTQSWASAILKLPESFPDKREVIRSIQNLHLTRKHFLEYKRAGIFDIKVLLKYWRWIKLSSSVSMLQYFWIAVRNPNKMQQILEKDFLRDIIAEQKKGRKTVIYGAGKYGGECVSVFNRHKVRLDGVLVSNAEENPTELSGHPVYASRQYLTENKGAYVVIAVAPWGVYDIAEQLEDMGIRDWVRYEM